MHSWSSRHGWQSRWNGGTQQYTGSPPSDPHTEHVQPWGQSPSSRQRSVHSWPNMVSMQKPLKQSPFSWQGQWRFPGHSITTSSGPPESPGPRSPWPVSPVSWTASGPTSPSGSNDAPSSASPSRRIPESLESRPAWSGPAVAPVPPQAVQALTAIAHATSKPERNVAMA